MLRIIESTSAGQAKSYYSTADYYTEGQELVGQWRGEGARRLGLDGEIRPQQWDALCDNRDPNTGQTLTLRRKDNRRVGYDFNFHVPKSVSVLHAMTQDDRLLDAFRDAVRETMDDVETEMQTRVRKGGRSEDRTTGNAVWGEFVHLTARPVDGLPDPHLHAHCFVFNTTYDEEEHAWKAGQFGSLKRDAPYFEAKFHVRLGYKLAQLGLDIERSRTGWEIAGITPSMVEKFSRRTAEIEEEARRKGIVDDAEKDSLGARTRERKQKHLTMEELRAEWRSRLTADEQSSLEHVASHIGQTPHREDPDAARHGIAMASDHLFERKSVVAERELQAESLKRVVGKTTVDAVEDAFRREKLIVRERKGRRMVTTAQVLSEERRMLQFARGGRGTRRAFAAEPHRFKREWLNEGQRQAVEHVLYSRDQVMLVRGAAGVGKTSMMQEAAEGIEESGQQVFTFAPSAKASRGVLREKGFENADTVQRLLLDEKLQQQIAGQVIWIDEAGMVGTRTMASVFELAERLDARVVLSGDRRQHGSVERGAALRLLEEEAGLVPAEIKEIQRQKSRYKQAIEDLSEDRTSEGFAKLDAMGWVKEIDASERYERLAADYVATVAAGESALVVSPTHIEAARITRSIRERLRSAGRITGEEHRLTVLQNASLTEGERQDRVNYAAGDVLVFHQNAKGFAKGQRVTVGEEPPPLDQAARFSVFHAGELAVAEGDVLRVTRNGTTADRKHRLNNGDLVQVAGFDRTGNIVTDKGWTIDREYGHLAYGFVVTSHASQGTDVDRVFIGQSAASFAASSREQFYVSASRGRKQVTIYTDNKTQLLDAVHRSDERLSATELLSSDMLSERGGWPSREQQLAGPLHRQSSRELAYER
ncbi:MobF family relaxase [Planctomyces sp. SH-PL14]|uniref:MobF family relaxase n=1 Tax=Planctomyces sp. SH-PL14 TaxID=1632864 RepID=UPI00078B5BDE|nr:MobF family relaxase [Planctomyces sp. SH-PL14]AMV22605.1 Multifunctional conjugation protein TraI [Planctomyces sp. SH-PL14]